ncbi:MAG: DUF4062 domain-containing protein [Candidatus Hydrogenedentes bacterium]|nr:DUF4062 domain-containing protein [Candidatus Hydrogenedentota bacterium]
MIPNIFISSTIADLQHLREALKDTVEELAYRPVLSEFGGIGYLPQASAEDSCYLAMRDCQIAVLIVGKRYGSVSANGRSVTHNEFLTSREQTIPVVCLVDREVLTYKKVYDATEDKAQVANFPGMELPNKTFSLIQEIMDAPANNAILPFDSVADARSLLKTQLAHVFGDLLRSKFDPVKAEIKDVLSEVMTLRQEMKNKDMDPQPFLRATRFLLDDSNDQLRNFVEGINGSVEVAVPLLLQCPTFEDYLAKTLTELAIIESTEPFSRLKVSNDLTCGAAYVLDGGAAGETRLVARWNLLRGKRAEMNSAAKQDFDFKYERLRLAAGV